MNRKRRVCPVSLVAAAVLVLLPWGLLADRPSIAGFRCSKASQVSPLGVRFDASSSQDPDGQIVIYFWTFGDGFTGSGETVVHAYDRSGSYTVTLLTIARGGARTTLSGLIQVPCVEEVFPFGTEVGCAAPEFTLPDLDGAAVRISDFRGQVVILDFWASWCKPCATTTPYLEALCERYQDEGVVLVGVTIDRRLEDARTFLTEHGYTHTIALWGSLDAARQVKALYEVVEIPHVFVIDRAGVIRFSGRAKVPDEADIEPWL